MRPLEKLNPGEYAMPDGTKLIIKDTYTPYSYAKPDLVSNFGLFCSYCEEAYHQKRDLHVEHVQPKNFKENGVKIYANLTNQWSNFLLSCATCNGPDNKDTKNVVLKDCHLPHLNNTFKSLIYEQGGVVEVNPALKGDAKTHALALIELVGLNKTPRTSKPGDTRCHKRRKDWILACRYKDKYDAGRIDTKTIVDFVIERGGWSIWFTVFKGCDDVRKSLLDFPGTAKQCFDASNHYEPIDRNPGLPDPT